MNGSQLENTKRPSVILVVSDQEWSSRSLDSILGPRGYAVLRAYSGRQALDLAEVTLPDAVICDSTTRDLSGFEVCRLLREESRVTALTPILLTSSSATARSDRLLAYRSGAWEFVPQPFDGEALLAQLEIFLAAKREGDQIREESLLDALTGLYSMRGLAKRAKEIGAEAYRLRVPLACVAFGPTDSAEETVNVSDAVVESMAAVLRSAGRVSDAIGRFGQAEFGIVAPATDADGVIKLVQRLRLAVENSPSVQAVDTRRIGFRVGFDAVPNYAESSVDAVEMLLRASAALRCAHADGSPFSIRAFQDPAPIPVA